MSTSEYFRQGWQYFNRLSLGQVIAVDTANGQMSVVFLESMDIRRDNIDIPMSNFSINGFNSSWDRHMPQVGDVFLIGFNTKAEARAICSLGSLGLYKAFVNQQSVDKTKVPYGDFIQLQPGEFDKRSSGGAYIYGDQYGNLTLAAGAQTQLRLNKPNNEARGSSGLYVIGGDQSFYRIGDVKRILLGGYKESTVDQPVPLDPLAVKESWMHLENPAVAPLAPTVQLVDEQQGAVRYRSGVLAGLPIPGSLVPAAFLRYLKNVWDLGTLSVSPVPTAAYSVEIDALGNQKIEYGVAATLGAVIGATVTMNVTLANLSLEVAGTTTVTTGGTMTIVSGGIATVTAPEVALGPAPVVHATRAEPLIAGLEAFFVVAAEAFGVIAGLEGEITPKGAQYLQLQALSIAAAGILPTVLSETVSIS